MTIRYLAEELYRWTRKVEELEKTLAGLEVDFPLKERDRLETELRQAKQQRPISGPSSSLKRRRPRSSLWGDASPSAPPSSPFFPGCIYGTTGVKENRDGGKT